ncbi:MAG: hypothetical protein K8T89_23245 [Planctomycetes bacterium]|nr:hypothetical protein [Planctomycetota bacterium]
MNQEPPIVLVLLTLRQLGSRSVPAKQDLFTKGLKKELEAAIAKGYVEKSKLIVQATGPNGKPKKSSIDILNMTSSGETALKQGANFEAFAATA